MNTGRASNTGRVSDIIVLIEAGGFYSRKYGIHNRLINAIVFGMLNEVQKFRLRIKHLDSFSDPSTFVC